MKTKKERMLDHLKKVHKTLEYAERQAVACHDRERWERYEELIEDNQDLIDELEEQ